MDDAPGGGDVYTGDWQHQTGLTNLYDGTLSSSQIDCNTACQGFSGVQGANNWSYQDEFNGVWRDMEIYSPANAPSSYLGMAQWTDTSPSQGGFVWPTASIPLRSIPMLRPASGPPPRTGRSTSRAARRSSSRRQRHHRDHQERQVVSGPSTVKGSDTTKGVEPDVNGLSVCRVT